MFYRKILAAILALMMTTAATPAFAKTKSKASGSHHTQNSQSSAKATLMGTHDNEIEDMITLEPLGFALGAATLEYEHMIDTRSSWAAGLKFGGLDLGDWKYSAFGVEGAFRFYPLDKFYAPRGLWVGPAVEMIHYAWSYYDENISVVYTNLLAEAGWKFVFGHGPVVFVLSPYAAMGYSIALGPTTITRNGVTYTAPFGGFTGFVGCSLGIGF